MCIVDSSVAMSMEIARVHSEREEEGFRMIDTADDKLEGIKSTSSAFRKAERII